MAFHKSVIISLLRTFKSLRISTWCKFLMSLLLIHIASKILNVRITSHLHLTSEIKEKAVIYLIRDQLRNKVPELSVSQFHQANLNYTAQLQETILAGQKTQDQRSKKMKVQHVMLGRMPWSNYETTSKNYLRVKQTRKLQSCYRTNFKMQRRQLHSTLKLGKRLKFKGIKCRLS